MSNLLKAFIGKKDKIIDLLVILLPLLVSLLVFRKYIFNNLLPIPADIFPGLYFPWFDYKWGYHTPVPVQNTAVSDVVSILYPWRILAFRLLKEGILPLWDPTILLGTPLLANFQSAVFNPINILFFVLPEYHAWSLGVIFQPILAVLFSYLFLRNLNLKKFPALFGSLLYAYSGYSIVWMEYNSINYTVALFPLILLAAAKISRRIDWKWFLILSVGIALQIFAGYPQNVIYTLAIAVAYFIFCLISEKQKTKKGLFFVLSLLVGMALSAIQLFPSAELQGLSMRNLDKVALAGDVKYLPVQNLITILFPDYFGNPGRWNYWGLGSFDNFAFSISSIGIYFALIAILFVKEFKDMKGIKMHSRFFLALTIFVFIFAIKNPISETISNIKILGFVSGSNTRILFTASFAFSLLSAYGLQLVMSRKLVFWKVILPLVFFAIPSLLLVIKLFNVSGNSIEKLYYLVTNKTVFPNELISHLIVAFRNTLLPTGLVIITASTLLFKRKFVVAVVALACLFVSIINTSDKYLPFVRKNLLFPPTELTDYLINHLGNTRFEKENNNLIFPSNSWSLYNLSAATGQDASGLLSTSRYLSIINFGKINDDIVSRYNNISNLSSPLLKTLNISHYAAINWLNDSPDARGKANMWLIPDSFKEVENIKTVRVYENKNNLGLAWMPKKILCEENESIIYQKIALSDYNPADTVYVDCGEGKFEGSGVVELGEYNANDMHFTVRSDNDSYLVVSNAYYPGWEARIDEMDTQDVNMANAALLAVKVPRGTHTVEIKYHPISFRWGVLVSGIALSICLLIFFVKIKPGLKNDQ
jgi:hypothetical protein